ncbi:hypothetical protein GGS21DRAFT_8593 [Xylaria nigripes]|nr:hypothetical protein GGS21DRAFT_8593 [Xylaria nigripes]
MRPDSSHTYLLLLLTRRQTYTSYLWATSALSVLISKHVEDDPGICCRQAGYLIGTYMGRACACTIASSPRRVGCFTYLSVSPLLDRGVGVEGHMAFSQVPSNVLYRLPPKSSATVPPNTDVVYRCSVVWCGMVWYGVMYVVGVRLSAVAYLRMAD